jgi:hypothetical protein
MHIAAAAEAPTRDHRGRVLVGQVRDEAAIAVEHEGANGYVEQQVGAGAPSLAAARTIRARLCLPARPTLVERQVGQLVGRLQRHRTAAASVTAVRPAARDEGLVAKRGGAAPAMPGAQDHPRRIDEGATA